jgi:hypothetical protein
MYIVETTYNIKLMFVTHKYIIFLNSCAQQSELKLQ